MSRYWSYTIKYVPRNPAPAGGERTQSYFMEHKIAEGEEYEPHCIDGEAEEGVQVPEDVITYINNLFPYIPEEVLVDKRPITKEEYDAWLADRERYAEEEAAYIRGERDTRPEW